ncbi:MULTISPECIES: UDP-N-acetylmuramoyl-tripeptide--D-alanyl-D-alanine ligase [Flavobacterium]|uniref:UDP-N-acetylmuramoyl-tripeptide--D-alanyl-D-alanine ligase n=1 Tax=Flavobacterium covae TaxID=2906076 RepID=A0ABW8PDW3_9FLAO|nr:MULTISPECIES: UDP-N-acetylmuramoyl-tripeptide--D-alanyl-D-alanine ligase [Flavobacterium]OXA82900.1 UDP-N-acetylmuramoyl-tripeptide--D-alanyl-D-alanine ligase [Flavobacterium columnare NBRC 100251 = ATCC 23463]AMA49746.1 UDP-N-acetylmuramoyl-tripeptide--D-alanyl-D-alanine ligase [Flavobacterium covae]AND63411.1 UDP-N-acetylmuramoyl-tripeptide--D-alanyl-D-alanine ligase [Flavobacterium covae]MCJ1809583.1 UDP-N-acetylmuramoyl-tripeptide--D-alanyl-D-alanine ligase [Flavobacterium covae]OWP8174
MKIEELYQCFLQCDTVTTDTRKITPNSFFFALKGEHFNANEFAQEALNKGALFAVIDEKKYLTDENKMFLVKNVLETLQELAHYHRNQLGLPIIALTGSNGKTTTKELINVVLSKKYKTIATIGNLNNHIGVPLTLLSIKEDTDIAIVEMGANHQKEIELLCSITEPDFGYITNFGKAHLEGFGGIEGVIKGKSEMYDYLIHNHKTIFINSDDPIQLSKTASANRYSFSTNPDHKPNVYISECTANPLVTINYNNININSHLIGIYNANNINAAITIGKYFNVADTEIKDAIENYIPNNNRSQLIEKGNNKIILDAYNANPSSMAAALGNFQQLDGSKIAFLGDMFELGNESLEEHKKIIESIIDTTNVQFYFIGKNFYSSKIEKEHIYYYTSFEDFIKNKPNEINNTTILIKGSRGMALERILDII